ncbi:complement component receptor 1-like protein, partial [Clarias magur]
QCKRPLVGDNRILSDESNNQTFPDGSTVRFHCAAGYTTASGSRKITCNGTRWTDLELQCKKKSCGDPGDILHGMYDKPDGIVFGAIITAKCKDGYQLAGLVNTKKCGVKGWEGRNPVCEVVKCQPPPPINDGTSDQNEQFYVYGEAVTYSCKGGRDLIGHSVITCSSDGTFQPPPPQCLFVSCDSPEMSNAVRIEEKSPPYKYKEFVRYQCKKGYKMEGSDLLTCTEKGWDSPPPQCAVISCSKPPAINNGVYTPQKESYGYRESITYSCSQGFGLTGTGTILCGDSGTFETIPQCQEISCDSPSIKNAVINGSSPPYKYDDSIQISCNEGYKIKGYDYLTCGEHGWNPYLSQCIEMTCDATKPNNAVIVGGEAPTYRYKMIIEYQCNKGYRMEGSNSLTCQESGWNLPPPKCKILNCSKPPDVRNGKFPPRESYEYGQTVTYSCTEGFRLHGTSKILCTEHGTFEHPPQCLEAICDEPQINHGIVIEGKSKSYKYKSQVRVQCTDGYQMNGSDYLTCKEMGWNPPSPQCNINHQRWRIPLIVVPVLIILIVVGVALLWWIKSRKCK